MVDLTKQMYVDNETYLGVKQQHYVEYIQLDSTNSLTLSSNGPNHILLMPIWSIFCVK